MSFLGHIGSLGATNVDANELCTRGLGYGVDATLSSNPRDARNKLLRRAFITPKRNIEEMPGGHKMDDQWTVYSWSTFKSKITTGNTPSPDPLRIFAGSSKETSKVKGEHATHKCTL